MQIHIGLPNNSEFSCFIVCNLIQTGSWVRNTLCCFRKQVPNSSSLLNPKSSPSSPKIFFFTHWNYLPSPSKSSPLPQNIFPFSGNSRNSITGSDMPSALGLVFVDIFLVMVLFGDLSSGLWIQYFQLCWTALHLQVGIPLCWQVERGLTKKHKVAPVTCDLEGMWCQSY